MTDAPAFGKIVVGVDDSTSCQRALEWAAAEAVRRHAPLHILYASTLPVAAWPVPPIPAGYMEYQAELASDILDKATATAEAIIGNAVGVSTDFLVATPTAALVEASGSAGMVVVGSRGRGALARTILGSVSTGVVHRAECPVAVIHDEDPPPDPAAPVLLGFDGSAASDAAVALAFEEASARKVKLVALHAWWSPGAFEMPGFDWETIRPEVDLEVSRQLLVWQQRHHDVPVERLVVPDRPAQRLVEQSRSAQLVVMGRRGFGAVASALLGSVSGAVVQAARVPLIVAGPR